VSPYGDATFNAVSCSPAWVKTTPAAPIIHAPPGVLSVYIPPSMWNQLSPPAIAAATELNNRMSGLITVVVVQTDCGSGGDCVRVVEVPTVAGGCAGLSAPSYGPTGEVDSVRVLELPTSPGSRDWRQRTPERLERTMVHEYLHATGLQHYEGCSVADSVMSPVTGLPESEICKSTAGMAIKPTQNDIPAAKSPYTNGVTRVCSLY
jgi:hypothetical protein